MSKRIVIFNHKGGVSKTTSTFNIGWMLSKWHRVLLVDADPQCNLSSLILDDGFEQYYSDPISSKNNIMDGARPAFSGNPTPIQAVDCKTPSRSNNLFLLAGHANLSDFEAALTFAQTSNNAITTLQNLPGAFSELIRLTEIKYNIDYTIIDLNPGLSAINQNLFIASDAFIIPTNPDPFSLMAIETLRTVLPRWAEWKQNAVPMFADAAYPLTGGAPKFIGSLIQRFNVRNGKAAKPYRDNISEIKAKIAGDFISTMSTVGMALLPSEYTQLIIDDKYCLNEIPDFQGLLPKSHSIGVPVYELLDTEIGETGPVFEQMKINRDSFRSRFEILAQTVARLAAHA